MKMNQQKDLNHENKFLISILTQSHNTQPSISATPLENMHHLANLHGVTPQLHTALKKNKALLDKEQTQSIQHTQQNILKQNLLLTAHLLSITKALDQYHFPYLSIKGPTLSHELYANIAMRQFSDIDLFVNVTDIHAISNILISLDFEPILPLSLLSRKKFLELDNDFSFKHKKSHTLIELHWKLFPIRHKMPLDFTELYKTSKKLKIQQRNIHTLSETHNLLYLALHGAKHIFERYEWVYDLDQLMRTYPHIDLEQLYLDAKKIQVEVPFLLGVFLSHHLFKTPLSDTFKTYHTPHIEELMQKVLHYYNEGFVYWDEYDKKQARFLFLADLFQDKQSKKSQLFTALFKTTPVDVITFNLPDNLAFLYPFLRPFRLVYKHLFTKKPVYAQI